MYMLLKPNKLFLSSVSVAAAAAVLLSLYAVPAVTGSGAESPVDVPIIMYHGLVKDPDLQNQYMIAPQSFEEDLQYLNANGFHTIFISELIGHFKNHTPLPPKPVILTFDDGYLNNYTYAYPLLQKYKCKAVISPIAAEADKAENDENRSPAYSQCSWSELREMSDSGYVEIQCHTYDLHTLGTRKGAGMISGESEESYRQVITADLTTCLERMSAKLGKVPQAFVYPFGNKNELLLSIIKEAGFEAVLDCEEKTNSLTSSQELFSLHRFLRPPDVSAADFFKSKNASE